MPHDLTPSTTIDRTFDEIQHVKDLVRSTLMAVERDRQMARRTERPSDLTITEGEGVQNRITDALATLRNCYEPWENVVRAVARSYAVLATEGVIPEDVAGHGLDRLRSFTNRMQALEWSLDRLSQELINPSS